MQLAVESFDKSRTYFTSGYRKGSQWLWDDGNPIEVGFLCFYVKEGLGIHSASEESLLIFDVIGEGRCLAIRNGAFQAVDCDSPGTALCEVARECVYHSEYNGKMNNSQSGFPCMKWNDPAVLFYDLVTVGQTGWDHNFCRIINEEETPTCFVSPTVRQACEIPQCPDSPGNFELKADLSSPECGAGFFPCHDSGRCLANDFRCDYEPDCDDASDEVDCEDFLSYFELIGTLKLADKITEIWTYIPHAQGVSSLFLTF
ncbi:Low-density lipoprotein receptor domain class A [Ostertagia ostertagi]